MNFETGFPIAVVRNKTNPPPLLKVDENKLDPPEIHVGKLEVLPIISSEKQNTRMFISGPSGSGKSTFVSAFLMNYKRLYPNKTIWCISRLKDDPAFTALAMRRIDATNATEVMQLQPEQFENSVTLWDDFEMLADKQALNYLYHIRNTLLETGRHTNTDVIVVSHQLLNSHVTKVVHLESNLVCVFPKSNFTPIANWLKRYLGVDKSLLSKIRKLNSRWVVVRRSYPQLIIYEGGAFLL